MKYLSEQHLEAGCVFQSTYLKPGKTIFIVQISTRLLTIYRVSPKKVPSIEIYPIVVKHRILCDWYN
jgi:hypothetical protein